MDHPKHILKFGGTSLQDKNFIQQAVQIVNDRSQSARPFVVVSAVEKVTDTLITLSGADETASAISTIDQLEQKHLQLFCQLADSKDPRKNQLQDLFNELKQTASRFIMSKSTA